MVSQETRLRPGFLRLQQAHMPQSRAPVADAQPSTIACRNVRPMTAARPASADVLAAGRQRRRRAPDSASGHAELLKSHGHLGGIA
ncbi:hypothetical protein [Xanthomonas sp. D-109]|uniref:hypothetical protein n=1 Tax=Xanthomonas sp. D-109 TaxID=2821274 RepID=UPI001ADA8350|nr:hypothetical protein [Xanthomonas sp. D-109]MBO9882626.1 hypothetical protein [Xanthomonas sp. D-109]